MRITESSIPGAVENDAALWLLTERSVLTSLVCTEEERRVGLYDRRPLAALDFLGRWIFEKYGENDGLQTMKVPEGAASLKQEIEIGEKVCDALRMSRTADTPTEFAEDMVKVQLALREWRGARATGFAPGGIKVEVPDDPSPFALYMIGHPALGIRKVGMTKADRLDLWRQRGWVLLDLKRFDTSDKLKSAEDLAKYRLDQMGARGTPLMEAIFSNLDGNGRTEMYDAAAFAGKLDELLGGWVRQKLGNSPPMVPLWITEPRSAAAVKATANRDNHAIAAKAVATRAKSVSATARGEAE